MTFKRVIYVGPPFDDRELLAELPAELSRLLLDENGLIAYGGGLHVRGACSAPPWHSLRAAWKGPDAVFRRYPAVQASDIPFAEDCLGDQYLLRDGVVLRLSGETGELSEAFDGLTDFIEAVRRDAAEALSLQPLIAFEAEGGRLDPGQLLSVYPPYCVQSAAARSFRAIAAPDRLAFLASLAEQIRDLPDGSTIDVRVLPPAV